MTEKERKLLIAIGECVLRLKYSFVFYERKQLEEALKDIKGENI